MMPDDRVDCPFRIVIDDREKKPYEFQKIRSNRDTDCRYWRIELVKKRLPVGDYGVVGCPDVIIERKSLADLYQSVARKANFERRLELMSRYRYAAVVVEAEPTEVVARPPSWSDLTPVSLNRIILRWRQRYAVDWHFLPGRRGSELQTFQILRLFHKEWIEWRPASGKPRPTRRPCGISRGRSRVLWPGP